MITTSSNRRMIIGCIYNSIYLHFGDKDGKHRVEFYVPDLSDDMKGPIYAYVTYEDGTVVTLEAVDVDYENKTVVFEFDQVPAKVVLFGKVMDIEFDPRDGCVEALVVPGETKMTHMLRGEKCGIVIPWQRICKIGENVILVQLEPGDLQEV